MSDGPLEERKGRSGGESREDGGRSRRVGELREGSVKEDVGEGKGRETFGRSEGSPGVSVGRVEIHEVSRRDCESEKKRRTIRT